MNGVIELSDGQQFEVKNVEFVETHINGKPMRTVEFSTVSGNQMLIFQDRQPILKIDIRKYRLASGSSNSQTASPLLNVQDVRMFVNSQYVDVEALAQRMLNMLEEVNGNVITESEAEWRNLLGIETEEHESFERALRKLKNEGGISTYREGGGEKIKISLK